MTLPSLGELPKGHQLPAFPFELSPEWVREYVASVEDAAIGQIDDDFVPPMAVAALALRALLEGARLPEGAIHLGQELDFQRPVRVGEKLHASARVVSRGERQGWVLTGVEMDVTDGDGSTVMHGRALATMPAAGGSA
jgi:acyl dehydratase